MSEVIVSNISQDVPNDEIIFLESRVEQWSNMQQQRNTLSNIP